MKKEWLNENICNSWELIDLCNRPTAANIPKRQTSKQSNASRLEGCHHDIILKINKDPGAGSGSHKRPIYKRYKDKRRMHVLLWGTTAQCRHSTQQRTRSSQPLNYKEGHQLCGVTTSMATRLLVMWYKWLLKGSRTHHPNICHFGVWIVLSWRQLRSSRHKISFAQEAQPLPQACPSPCDWEEALGLPLFLHSSLALSPRATNRGPGIFSRDIFPSELLGELPPLLWARLGAVPVRQWGWGQRLRIGTCMSSLRGWGEGGAEQGSA